GSDNTQNQNIAADLSRRTRAAKDQVVDATHRTASKVGDQMQSVAKRIRESGPNIESALHSTAESLADKLDKGGQYLRQRQYQGIGDNLTAYIRRHPATSLVVGVIAGLFIARKVRR
ncbi:MAG: hypothetical protein ACREQO_09590, partial [Candidatus Binatia bacterium]